MVTVAMTTSDRLVNNNHNPKYCIFCNSLTSSQLSNAALVVSVFKRELKIILLCKSCVKVVIFKS